MDLTDGLKQHIDGMTYHGLLERWRNAPSGDEWFQGETGKYWGERMAKMKAANPGGAVAASKSIGWDGPA